MQNTTHLFRRGGGKLKKTALRTKLFSGTLISATLCCFIFTSCDNFLDGAGLKNQLNQTIEYNNAPYATVEIAIIGAETASIIPAAGTYKDRYKTNDDIELKFEAQSGYCFSHWQAIPEDSVKFADKNAPVTTAKINTADKTVTIKPVSLSRPKVVSATPTWDSNGVYRDRTLIVMFNKDMDESSIYWTKEELEEMHISLENALPVDDSQFYYAYRDSENPDLLTYKNIEITKYNDASVNLLQYYGVPRFDLSNKKILRIPANNKSIPPSATDILVTLRKEFFYKADDSNSITLSDDYDWPYYTNGNYDDEAPSFVDDENNGFTVTIADNPTEGEEEQKNYKTENAAVKQDKNDFNEADFDLYKSLNSKNKKLWVRGSFTDVGSGPGSLKWEVYKVGNDFYPCASEEEQQLIQAGQIKNLNIVGFNASVNPVYAQGSNFDKGGELVEITNLEKEGLYRIDFIASDKNDRSIRRSYYFVHDAKSPKPVARDTIKNYRPSASTETITWTDPDDSDFVKIYIEQYLNGEKIAGYEVSKGVQSHSFTGMAKGKYQYKFYTEDVSGNKTKIEDTVEWQDDVKPAKPDNVYISSVGKKRIRINYKIPDNEDYDYLIISGSASEKIENGTQGTEYSFEHKNVTGISYNNTYYLQSVDFAGNISDYVEISPEAGNITPGMICYKSKTDNDIENFFFSFEYISDMDPLGVVCDNSDTSKIKIWDLSEVTGWNWGTDNKPCSNEMGSYGIKYYWDGRNHADGLTWYNLILKDYWYLSNEKSNGHYTIWNWLRTQKNVNAPVTWYIPGIYEYESIINNYSKMKESFDLLSNNGKSVKLFTEKQPYWTASPRYSAGYANVVMLNKSNEGCAHELCNNGSNTLYITGDYKQDQWYYKDEINARKGSDNKALITHAMAQVNMN